MGAGAFIVISFVSDCKIKLKRFLNIKRGVSKMAVIALAADHGGFEIKEAKLLLAKCPINSNELSLSYSKASRLTQEPNISNLLLPTHKLQFS